MASRLPDHVALTGGGRRWTYDALDRHANRIARAILARASAGPGCVAYLVEHSPEMVVATLGVLKAGKTYVALHPAVPAASQQAILGDVVPQLLLVRSSQLSLARQIADGLCDVVDIDAIDAQLSDRPPLVEVAPGAPSTLFYTSGTTGTPKGVVKSHRAVLHRVWLSAVYDRVSHTDRQSLLTHCSFSASESDIFGALLQGATVCVFDIATQGLATFRDWLLQEQITLLHPPVLLFRRFLAMLADADRFPSIRLLAFAGDVVRPADLRRWRQHSSPASVVFHRFSITETAMLTVARVDEGTALHGDIVDAGQPVPDKEVSLVDADGAAVAAGDIGEVIVKSAYLADGYWGRPGESRAAFVPDPERPGITAYRTGDLGRFADDGTFTILGRRDHQVKIRGYRVELREIESVLLELPAVAEAAVLVDDRTGEPRLLAWLVARDGTPLDVAAVRDQLSARLPAWKVPAEMFAAPALPLTLNGKIDRQRLIAQMPRTAPSAAMAVTPVDADPAEAIVARLFGELLKRPSVDRVADFFDLGGNSLMLLELQLALEQSCGGAVTIRDLVRQPTVAGIASYLRARTPAAPTDGPGRALHPRLVPLRQEGTARPLFLVHAAGGRPTTNPRFLDTLGQHHPVFGFEARGFREEPPHATIAAMAQDYIGLMRMAQATGPYWIGATCAGGLVAVEMAAQLRAVGEQVAPLLLIDPWFPPREQSRPRFMIKRALLDVAAALTRFAPFRTALVRYLGGRRSSKRGLDVWVRFRIAAYSHQPGAAYDGPVFIVGSRKGLGYVDAGRWARHMSGPIAFGEAGESHRDVFNLSVEESVAALRRYLIACDRWFADPRGSSTRPQAQAS